MFEIGWNENFIPNESYLVFLALHERLWLLLPCIWIMFYLANLYDLTLNDYKAFINVKDYVIFSSSCNWGIWAVFYQWKDWDTDWL